MLNNLAAFKKLKAFIKSGINPVNWLYELTAVAVRKQQQKPTSPISFSHSHLSLAYFSLDAKEIHTEPSKVIRLLDEYGLCVINNLIETEVAKNAGQQLLAFLASDKCSSATNSTIKEHAEEDTFIWQTDYAWSNNYLEVAKTEKPVINIRARDNEKDDAGMIDIFGIEKLAKTENLYSITECLEAMSQAELKKILIDISSYQQRQFNTYINQGITRTRGPHIDNNNDPYKIFVYLTDVKKESDGPYCYLPGSQKHRQWMSYERLYNAVTDKPSTEVSSIEREQLTKLFGKAGTAIITNQSGVHCGWPQAPDAERILLVSNYY